MYNNTSYNNQDPNSYSNEPPFDNNLSSKRGSDYGKTRLNRNQGISTTGLDDTNNSSGMNTADIDTNDSTLQTQGQHTGIGGGNPTFRSSDYGTTFSGPQISDVSRVDQSDDRAMGQSSYDMNAPYGATGGNVPGSTYSSSRYGSTGEQRSDIQDLPTSRSGHGLSSGFDTAGDSGMQENAALGSGTGFNTATGDNTQSATIGSGTGAAGAGLGSTTAAGTTGGMNSTGGTGNVAPGLGAGALGTGAVESVVKNDRGVNDMSGDTEQQDQTMSSGAAQHKPSSGEKIKGNLEKLTGKLTGNQQKVTEGDNLAHGRSL
ncbi:hypothetical protein G6F46_010720 [Rhizopus delemar]|uniref:CsbD-like domain-containing protein n=3 Tax=Rhizopus TaxID=4842 RepID=I1BPW2_RHIO9|nr:hypothetical protein RO3G_02946 [Rhizopus delemar RA 99-880]KAG1051064.1 hypothetical protein G6F43_006710 [Rhizopus delemar]KAG1536744.1 hypothetical protein G6F51_010791 [Rhizopus arrhizus]KAG1449813.1 hypothetical protein G6F55_009990 [Rhizopus delemar]KAG1490983.1 hypothetical protein G6F54_010342 [Rhizopus delemar]|eukprot:EIE78242.1 hypothetical protein RO3G_02946 [Rhizopus delemar RA 99-880]